MISFSRDDKKVVAKVEMKLVGNVYYPFVWDCDGAEHAELLKRYFQDNLSKSLEAIRQCAYSEGYADGRGHRQREREFFDGF